MLGVDISPPFLRDNIVETPDHLSGLGSWKSRAEQLDTVAASLSQQLCHANVFRPAKHIVTSWPQQAQHSVF